MANAREARAKRPKRRGLNVPEVEARTGKNRRAAVGTDGAALAKTDIDTTAESILAYFIKDLT
jgi:hypothetical protein